MIIIDDRGQNPLHHLPPILSQLLSQGVQHCSPSLSSCCCKEAETSSVAAAGASFLPYLITDRVVAPENCQHCYTEHLAYMPNCYFVNDYKAAHQDVLDEANLPTR